MIEFTPATKYEIAIGFNDKETMVQKHSEALYEKIIVNVCRGYKVAYTINLAVGGYTHEDGTYIKENSATITLLGPTDEQVEEIAKDLCAFLNQESVMVTKYPVGLSFVSDDLGL